MAGVQCSFERVEKKFVLTHAQAEAGFDRRVYGG